MTKLLLILICLAAVVSLKAFGSEDPKQGDFRIGVITGNVGLLKDVGDDAGNAIGFGGVFNYNISDDFFFEGSYIQSSHDNLDHQEFNFGVGQYFESYETAYFYWTAGVLFATNDLELVNAKDTGFGLYGGAGLDIYTAKNIAFGLQARYNKIFEKEKQVSGNEVKVVQDFYTVMFKIQYTF